MTTSIPPPPNPTEIHGNEVVMGVLGFIGKIYPIIVIAALFSVLFGLVFIKKRVGKFLFISGIVIVLVFFVWMILFFIKNP